MNKVFTLRWEIRDKIQDIKHKLDVRKYKKLYPDYEDNEYNLGSLKHIWGIKSSHDFTVLDACFYTMNDIDITYDRKLKLYYLGIETGYMFNGKQVECEYLKDVLNMFTQFMDENNYSKEYDINLFMTNPSIVLSAETIEELYAKFKIYVDGYCSFYGYKEELV